MTLVINRRIDIYDLIYFRINACSIWSILYLVCDLEGVYMVHEDMIRHNVQINFYILFSFPFHTVANSWH